MNYGLGRLPAQDDRDRNFLLKSVLPKASTRTYRYWNDMGWWGDQGSAPQCVGFSWAHWLEDGPFTHWGAAPILEPGIIYCEAQKVDEWTGDCTTNSYDGTSVRAGAKVLQARGYISEYRWATSIKDVQLALLERGPIVVGTNWYSSMFNVDSKGFIRITPDADLIGGHAYLINGVNASTGHFRIKNSWGRGWGMAGRAWITSKTLERLIFDEDGEAVLAIERRPS